MKRLYEEKLKKKLWMSLKLLGHTSLFLILVSSSMVMVRDARADIYKWVDKDGNVQYTQSPPHGNKDYSTIKPPPSVDGSQLKKRFEAQKKIVDKSQEQRKTKVEEEYYTRLEKEQKQSNCELARRRLVSYQLPRVQFLQKDGSRVRGTEEQRQEEIKKSQDMVKEYCN
jgi:hypothetical protein